MAAVSVYRVVAVLLLLLANTAGGQLEVFSVRAPQWRYAGLKPGIFRIMPNPGVKFCTLAILGKKREDEKKATERFLSITVRASASMLIGWPFAHAVPAIAHPVAGISWTLTTG